MAWWQKKLLRYALSRTGFLDDKSVDLDNLDVTFGKQNVFHFKDVGLNIKRISKLAQLPSTLRVETARVLSLRLTVPADIYQSNIVAEVDGVELSLRLDEQEKTSGDGKSAKARSPVTTRSPQHRKAHRRLHSPPPYDPGGFADSDDEHLPTTQEMAKSFLMEEPMRERMELEASVAAQTKGMEESIASESSEGTDYGTGATVGVPGFLAGFLQGIVDRLQVKVKNIRATLETELPGDPGSPIPVTLVLHIGHVQVGMADLAGISETSKIGESERKDKRQVKLSEVYLDLQSDAEIFSELSDLPSRSSPSASRQQSASDVQESPETTKSGTSSRPSTASTHRSAAENQATSRGASIPDVMRASTVTEDYDRFADAGDDAFSPTMRSQPSDLDIQPGDDNIRWGSRRVKSNAPVEDLWNSMASEDDLPDSLLLDRASTPRVPSTRSASPAVTRTPRELSPYSRHLQSPGPWPRIDESHDHPALRQGPGSWPTLDLSRLGIDDTLAAASAEPNLPNTDIRLTALDLDPDSPSPVSDTEADLAASNLSSRQEAESMFMSAISRHSMHVPGGWASETIPGEAPSSPSHYHAPAPLHVKHEGGIEIDDSLAYGEFHAEPAAFRSGQATPRAGSPMSASPVPTRFKRPKAEKSILHVDSISIWVPKGHSQPQEAAVPRRPASGAGSVSFAVSSIPGTFSAYSEMTASRRHNVLSPARQSFSGSSILDTHADSPPTDGSAEQLCIDIDVGSVTCQLDISCGRVLHGMSLRMAAALPTQPASRSKKANESHISGSGETALSASVGTVKLVLKENVSARFCSASQSSDHLFGFDIGDLRISLGSGDVDVEVGTFGASLGTSRLLSFDKSREMRTSLVLSKGTPDIAFTITNRTTAGRRVVKDVVIETMPVALVLDLGAFDSTFSSLGGLSGILEAGNSMLCDSGMSSSPTSPKVAKGVRFEGEPVTDDAATELKLNGRIGGISAVLVGETCSVQLRTTTLKTVYREQGISATIEHAALSGPHGGDASGALNPIILDLATARLDYLITPKEPDLDRLISLLTPSKDKYDTEDDILVDTLLRQRRKGAVARVSIASINANVNDWRSTSTLQAMGNELSKLSAVAKYLPEDDRPGLLSLIRIKEVEARLSVNDNFGKLHLNFGDVHCAHVGLPALLALSIGYVRATQNDQTDIVHPLLPTETLPMIMLRTLGDEIEPVVKVKLFNLCAEYSVPLLLAATGLDKDSDGEDVVTELARSIADIALPDKDDRARQVSPTSDTAASAKKMKVEVLIHDSALGLQPQQISCKAMFVLTNAQFSTTVPPEATVTASLQLRRAAIFVADELLPENLKQDGPSRSTPSNSAANARVTTALSKRGYVSVGSILAASVDVRAVEPVTSEGKIVDVNVRNELLLLETCADSTQTLIATLNGLAPPTPPSKQPKYLTEPMTIEDMMASFSGEPRVKQDQPSETMFDAEAEPGGDSGDLLDMPGFDEDDEGLLAESEMGASLYGPISGMLEGDDKPEGDDDSDNYPETAASLLEDDPFEMPDAPADARMSDATLMRELNKQCKPSVSDQPVDLGLYEVEDLGFDALGGGQQPLGSQHRFSTPAARGGISKSKQKLELPFKLRLRDLHIIWNIYDGYDWKRTREGISEAVEQVEMRAEERQAMRRQSYNDREDDESVIGDFLFNSIYIGVPSNHDAQELRRQINKGIDDLASETESVPMSGMSRPMTVYSASGRPLRQRQRRRLKLERSKEHKVAFELKGVSADVLVYPVDNPDTVNSVDLRIKDFTIFDNVPTSTWRKFLTHLESDPAAREMSKPTMHIELANVKTLEQYAASEIVMHVAVLPLRLHVDQDALDFITRFFEFKDEGMAGSGSGNDQPFLQRVEVDTVDMCLDYKPKRVDYGGIRSGHYTEFKNFVILDGANIKLKHAIIYGIKGFEPLHQTLNDVWMPDIKRNQLPTVLAGLAPVRSLVNIGSGVRDVVAIPIREYRKDGRIVRSIQKGAMQFGKTTTSELARLGAKVAMGTQTLLTGAEGLLSPASASPSGGSMSGRRVPSEQGWHDATSSDDDGHEQRAISAYANQPLGVFSGLRSARRQLEHDLLTAKDALIAVQGEVLESGTPGSAAAAVARHAPTLILRPVIGASRAVGTALLGVGNQIDRSNVRKNEDKYKRR